MFYGKRIEEAKMTQRGRHFILETVKGLLVYIVLMNSVTLFSVPILYGLISVGLQAIGDLAFFWGEAFGIVLLILFCKFGEKRPARTMGFVKAGAFRNYLKGLGIGFAVISATVAIGCVLGAFRFTGPQSPLQPIFLLLYFSAFMIQGMYEEVLCRGFLMVSITRKNSIMIAVIINSLFFGLIHIGNNGFALLPMLNLTLFGVFSSLLFLVTDNIWTVGAVHTVWNFSMGCVYGLRVSGMELMPSILTFQATEKTLLNGGSFGPEGGIIITIVLLFSTAIVILKSKKQ